MAWLITKDFLDTDGSDAIGQCGPSGIRDAVLAKLETGQGFKFRLLDDDGEVYYHGISDRPDSFAPLDNFGMPHAGAVDIQYSTRTGWQSL